MSKATTQLTRRVVAFAGCFGLISGVLGARIVGAGLINKGGFEIYGTLGKVAIFWMISFVLMARRRKDLDSFKAPGFSSAVWFAVAVASSLIAWQAISQMIAGQINLQNLLLTHTGLLLACLSALVGCFGISNLITIVRCFWRELTASLALALAFWIFLLGVYALWQVMAAVVLSAVGQLMALIRLPAIVIPPNTLLTDKFGITVAQYCSGVESIALFSGLYIVVGLLDWRRLRLIRYLMVFPLALALLFGLNILRVFGLIVAGYYINPQIAFSLFHTYAGLMFFVLFSGAFWALSYKHLVRT